MLVLCWVNTQHKTNIASTAHVCRAGGVSLLFDHRWWSMLVRTIGQQGSPGTTHPIWIIFSRSAVAKKWCGYHRCSRMVQRRLGSNKRWLIVLSWLIAMPGGQSKPTLNLRERLEFTCTCCIRHKESLYSRFYIIRMPHYKLNNSVLYWLASEVY